MARLPLAVLISSLLTQVVTAAVDSRTAFLQLIDRLRVPLAPVVGPANPSGDTTETAFSFATEAGQRVPGLLIRSTTPEPGPRPVVIVLHGTGGSKESERNVCLPLARSGFVAVAIDGRYHGERAQGGKAARSTEYIQAILRTYRTGKELPFFYDTVWDVVRLIDYLETRSDVDVRRIGVIGFSKGGVEAYLAAAVDPRIGVVVPCIGVQSFRWATENNAWQSRIGTIQAAFDAAAKEAGVINPDGAFVRRFYDRMAPGLYDRFDGPAMLPLIAPRPLLVINGDRDPRTPLPGLTECINAARSAYEAANASDRIALYLQPDTAHQVRPEALERAQAWFERWLKPELGRVER